MSNDTTIGSGSKSGTQNRNIPVSSFSNMVVTNNVITDVESLTGPGVSVYPNPASDRITVESDGANINAVEIMDITGKRILLNELKSPRQPITYLIFANCPSVRAR